MLEKLRKSLVSDVADVEPVLDHLISAGVFQANDDDVVRIRAGETARMRVRILLMHHWRPCLKLRSAILIVLSTVVAKDANHRFQS